MKHHHRHRRHRHHHHHHHHLGDVDGDGDDDEKTQNLQNLLTFDGQSTYCNPTFQVITEQLAN